MREWARIFGKGLAIMAGMVVILGTAAYYAGGLQDLLTVLASR